MGRFDILNQTPIHQSNTTLVLKAHGLQTKDYYLEKFQIAIKKQQEDSKGGGRNTTHPSSLSRSKFREVIQSIDPSLKQDDKRFEKFFDEWDTDGDGMIAEDEFIHCCQNIFGGGHDVKVVALKFMKYKDQYQKELNLRKALEGRDKSTSSKYLVDVLHNYQAEDGNDYEKEIKCHELERLKDKDVELASYRFCIVMPYGERNLDTIYRSEQPGLNVVRGYLEEIGTALAFIHKENWIHGDLKLLNALRCEGKIKVIDMDASAQIPDHNDGDKEEGKKKIIQAKYFPGSKFSSGVLPPEMVYCLEEAKEYDSFKAYFATVMNKQDKKEWKKIKPMYHEDNDAYYGIKNFRTKEEPRAKKLKNKEGMDIVVVDENKLPYELIKATPEIDVWSFGALLFQLLTEKPLFHVNRNDDISSAEDYKELYNWSPESKKKKLSHTNINATARDLLTVLLSKEPKARGTISEALKHPFLVDVDNIVESIKKTVNILNDLKFPQGVITIESKQFIAPKGGIIKFSKKDNTKDELEVTCDKETSKFLQGRITYSIGDKKKFVEFNLKHWKHRDTIKLTNLDSDSCDNVRYVQLMDHPSSQNVKEDTNNLNDLPEEYRNLYGKVTYEFLITGSTNSENWEEIKKKGFDEDLHNLFHAKPNERHIYCYLFTGKGDIGQKNFAFARTDGKQITEQNQLKEFAKYIRRMYTGLYDDLKELYIESDEDFVIRLDKSNKVESAFCEWTLQEYKTIKWFYNELPSKDSREVIFSPKYGSDLRRIFDCVFPKYYQGSGEWAVPFIKEAHISSPGSESIQNVRNADLIGVEEQTKESKESKDNITGANLTKDHNIVVSKKEIEELKASNEELKASTEKSVKASNEELKASNEELKASNEELKASNEELKASIEELKASNEELKEMMEELKKMLIEGLKK